MSVATVAKSEMRHDENVRVGYGEVPAVYVRGITGWALIDGTITFSEEEAIMAATQLDRVIRRNLRDVKQLEALC